MTKFRGYEVEWRETEWIFVDTGKPTIATWQNRPCGYCDKWNTPEGYDGCIGFVPGLINACCGHGNWDEAYAQYSNGYCIEGIAARYVFGEVVK